MCLSPETMYEKRSGKTITVPCKSCDLCRQNRVNDLIGRCIAEQCTASKTFAVTLTYAGDGPESAVLRYADIQKFLKLLRAPKGGDFKVRYICAGEYGAKKGRAHWHIILFFDGKYPDVEIGSRINWKYWPHGYSYFQNPDYKGFAYVMKYALKQDPKEGYQKSLAMSKKPPLGYKFFVNLAHDIVERQLPVHSPVYSFSNVVNSKGVPRQYWLQGRMREIFLDRYYISWRMLYGKEPPWSEYLLEKYLDPIERKRMELDEQRYLKHQQLRQDEYLRKRSAQIKAEYIDDLSNRRQQLAFLILNPPSSDIMTAYTDGSAEVLIGDERWQVKRGSVTVAEQLHRAGLPISKSQQLARWLESQWYQHQSLLQKLSQK